MTVSQPETTWKLAAQPCSYIYPIYSVVKNHGANRITALSLRTLRCLEHSCSRFNLRKLSQKLNLKQLSLDLHIDMPIEKYGGAERDRTVDPLLAKQVLSQLSYSPLLLHKTMTSLPDRRDKGGGPG
jgi:hypothetical protein